MERIIGLLISGIGARVMGASAAIYIASYAVIAFCDAIERVRAALP